MRIQSSAQTTTQPRRKFHERLSTPDGTLIETLASPGEVGDEICLIRGTVPPGVEVPLEVMPGNLKGAALANFVRDGVVSYWHQTCTGKMGRDSMSVVDSRLRVHGIDNLRIADGSIMPRITTGNTMAPCVVIGKRAAEILKSEHKI
jgi:choline dehydrogenase